MIGFLSKKRDIIEREQDELSRCVSQFDEAVSIVTSTINKLGTINDEIQWKIKEIDEYQEKLAETKAGLDEAMAKNNRIIHNFNSLIEG